MCYYYNYYCYYHVNDKGHDDHFNSIEKKEDNLPNDQIEVYDNGQYYVYYVHVVMHDVENDIHAASLISVVVVVVCGCGCGCVCVLVDMMIEREKKMNKQR